MSKIEQKLTDSNNETAELLAQNTALETRLADSDEALERLQDNYEKLQAELICYHQCTD